MQTETGSFKKVNKFCEKEKKGEHLSNSTFGYRGRAWPPLPQPG